MTVVARKVRATPERSSSKAWEVIVDLIAPSESEARRELVNIAGIASSLVSDEVFESDPGIVWGAGPRVRIYCLYNEDAITGDDANEAKLSFVPTEGDWKMSLPCKKEDIEWVNKALEKKSKRVTARERGSSIGEENYTQSNFSKDLEINVEEFLNL